jgi:hypothetical protein
METQALGCHLTLEQRKWGGRLCVQDTTAEWKEHKVRGSEPKCGT